MTGFTFDQVQAEPHLWERRLHPDDRERVLAALARARRDRPIFDRVSLAMRRRQLQAFPRPGRAGEGRRGRTTEFAGTLTDVTEQRMLESRLIQAQKMDAIGQLTGGIAHDFNNLLSAVIGGIHLLERRVALEGREQLIVDQMRHAAEQGAELVRRMMAFARKQELTPDQRRPRIACAIPSRGLVEHTLGGTVTSTGTAPKRSKIYVDKSQLELALVNLILNARDAMPDGGGSRSRSTMSSSSRRKPDRAEAGHYVRISVSDQGEGIPGEIVEPDDRALFYHQGSRQGDRPRPVDGRGLRPAVGRQAARSIAAPGEGTTIELILAVDRPAGARSEVSRAKRSSEPISVGQGGTARR